MEDGDGDGDPRMEAVRVERGGDRGQRDSGAD